MSDAHIKFRKYNRGTICLFMDTVFPGKKYYLTEKDGCIYAEFKTEELFI